MKKVRNVDFFFWNLILLILLIIYGPSIMGLNHVIMGSFSLDEGKGSSCVWPVRRKVARTLPPAVDNCSLFIAEPVSITVRVSKLILRKFKTLATIRRFARSKKLTIRITGALSSPVSGNMSETRSALARHRSNHSTVYMRLQRLKL